MAIRRIAVTGALGHIGSQLIRQLPQDELEEIILIDNLMTQRYCSLFNLPRACPFRFIEADVLQADLPALLRGVDAVIHLAAITDAATSHHRKELVESVNYDGTRRVADACGEAGARLLFVSTTSVYGSQDDLVDEDCPPAALKPQSPYAESKLRAERYLAEHAGLRYIVCRFGTIYGISPGMRFHTAVNKFCWQACMGRPISVWTTALDQKRPYLDLTDAVGAIGHILKKDMFEAGTYNVLTDNATVRQLVEILRERVPQLQVAFVDSPIMNQLSYHVANDKFQRTGFAFAGSLAAGIRQTLDLLWQANQGHLNG